MWRCFKIRENVHQKVVGIGVAIVKIFSIAVLLAARLDTIVALSLLVLSIIEDNNLVYAENGESTSDLPC